MFHNAGKLWSRLRGAEASGPDIPEVPPALPPPFMAPLWLIAPPVSPAIPWTWALPRLDQPVSQMCTSEQMQGEVYEQFCRDVGNWPHFHRKLWEYTYIWGAFRHYGVLREGARVLGFGVGKESLASAFASRGLEVTATDAPPEIGESLGWSSTGQHVVDLHALHWPALISVEDFDRQVRFRTVDMNAIPSDLEGYDGCWSSCALEHLGSIDHGLDFIENSLETLRPGGVAVHTTELNLSSNTETFDQHHLALYRRYDIERLVERLVSRGHTVAPLNFYPGTSPVDEHIDLPPYSQSHLPDALPHLKLKVAGYVTTSFGLIVRRGESA